jgi:hypothetical protein
MRPFLSRQRRRWILCALVALMPACSSCGESQPQGSDAPAVELAPVPEPAGLVGELVVQKPGEAWTRLRDLGGGPARLMPAGFGMLVTTLLGIPAGNAESLDTDIPVTGAIAEDGENLSLALSAHVKSGPELLARLSKGADASFDAKHDDQSGITLLVPKPGKASTEVQLGVIGNYLVVSTNLDALKKLAPYAARTLSKQPPPKEAIVVTLKKQALSGPLLKRLRAWWQQQKKKLEQSDLANRQKHGRGTPDFGDPAAAVAGLDSAVEGIAGLLGSSSGARLTVEPSPERLDARLEVTPEKTGALAELLAGLNVGSADELLALPNDTSLGLLTRTTKESRESSAKSIVTGLSDLFKDRMSAADKRALETALTALAHGRGDWETYGVLLKGGKGGLVYRAGVSDPKAFDTGARGVLKAFQMKAFAEPLHQFLGDITFKPSTTEVPGVPGKVERMTIGLKPSPMQKAAGGKAMTAPNAPAPAAPRAVDVLWLIADGKVYGALSFEALPVLAATYAAPTDKSKSHASDPLIRAAIGRVGKEAAFVVMLQPNRLGIAGMASLEGAAPVVLSVGRSSGNGWLKLDADRGATEALVKNMVLGN